MTTSAGIDRSGEASHVGNAGDMSPMDLATLKIAFVLAAVDGHVDKCEYDCFETLAQALPGYNVAQAAKTLEQAEHTAGYLELVAKKGLSEKDFLSVFMHEIEKDVSWADFRWDKASAFQAFALWIAMAMVDKEYSKIERKAMELLRAQVNWAIARPSGAGDVLSGAWGDGGHGSFGETITVAYLKRIESMVLSVGRAVERLEKSKGTKAKETANADYVAKLQELKDYVESSAR